MPSIKCIFTSLKYSLNMDILVSLSVHAVPSGNAKCLVLENSTGYIIQINMSHV